MSSIGISTRPLRAKRKRNKAPCQNCQHRHERCGHTATVGTSNSPDQVRGSQVEMSHVSMSPLNNMSPIEIADNGNPIEVASDDDMLAWLPDLLPPDDVPLYPLDAMDASDSISPTLSLEIPFVTGNLIEWTPAQPPNTNELPPGLDLPPLPALPSVPQPAHGTLATEEETQEANHPNYVPSAPLPLMGMSISLPFALGPMPPHVEDMSRLALNELSRDFVLTLGGTKDPCWSTTKIMIALSKENTAVLHLLVGVTLAELSFRQSYPQLFHSAAVRYQSCGMEALRTMMNARGPGREPDPLLVVLTFWLRYYRQRRRDDHNSGEGLSAVSQQLATYYRSHHMDRFLTALKPPIDARSACLARLTSWLFWVDAAAGFYGDGGFFAQYLTESTNALNHIYALSKKTLSTYFGGIYPVAQTVDDNENELALELIHQTWIVVQAINEVLAAGPVDAETYERLGSRVENLVTGDRYAAVIRDAEDDILVRDRRLGNADWAVSNLYALCILFSRCRVGEPVLFSLGQIRDVGRRLMDILYRSITGGPLGQADRMQWPLFWAVIETRDIVHEKEFVLKHLSNHYLAAALTAVLREQRQTGQPMRAARIREICRQTFSPT